MDNAAETKDAHSDAAQGQEEQDANPAIKALKKQETKIGEQRTVALKAKQYATLIELDKELAEIHAELGRVAQRAEEATKLPDLRAQLAVCEDAANWKECAVLWADIQRIENGHTGKRVSDCRTERSCSHLVNLKAPHYSCCGQFDECGPCAPVRVGALVRVLGGKHKDELGRVAFVSRKDADLPYFVFFGAHNAWKSANDVTVVSTEFKHDHKGNFRVFIYSDDESSQSVFGSTPTEITKKCDSACVHDHKTKAGLPYSHWECCAEASIDKPCQQAQPLQDLTGECVVHDGVRGVITRTDAEDIHKPYRVELEDGRIRWMRPEEFQIAAEPWDWRRQHSGEYRAKNWVLVPGQPRRKRQFACSLENDADGFQCRHFLPDAPKRLRHDNHYSCCGRDMFDPCELATNEKSGCPIS
jgi:hypothetical protein